MSKGISWRQIYMLEQLLALEQNEEDYNGEPIAWRMLKYGWTNSDYRNYVREDQAKIAWNVEQAQRRSLRNLEQRGLVTTGHYVFMPYAESYIIHAPDGHMAEAEIRWYYVHPRDHLPGESRRMTGVQLTDAGRQVAEMSIRARGRPLTDQGK
jgi:hypothetical protein